MRFVFGSLPPQKPRIPVKGRSLDGGPRLTAVAGNAQCAAAVTYCVHCACVRRMEHGRAAAADHPPVEHLPGGAAVFGAVEPAHVGGDEDEFRVVRRARRVEESATRADADGRPPVAVGGTGLGRGARSQKHRNRRRDEGASQSCRHGHLLWDFHTVWRGRPRPRPDGFARPRAAVPHQTKTL